MRKRKYTHLTTHHKGDIICDFSTVKQQQSNDGFPQAQIHNLVSTAMIKSSVVPLILHDISRLLPNVTYDKQKFAAITIRLHYPACTSLLFTSGKMVLTGCKNFTECVLASHYIVRLLRRAFLGVSFQLVNVQIQNIVGNVDLKLKNQEMDLNRLFAEHGVFCTYQKNMFPGLIYRPNNSPVVLLIFTSGKIVITGGKSSLDILQGWKQLWPFVQKYIVDTANA